MTKADLLSLRIHAIRYGAEGVLIFSFQHPEGLTLPRFDPGAHVDVHLPSGLVRSYSLINDPTERYHYEIAVRRAEDSRGGSAWLHNKARVGERVDVGTPRNNFSLREDAIHTTLVAGGIGITPLWSMIRRLEQLHRPWTLHYRCSSRSNAAFLTELEQSMQHGIVNISVSDEGAPRFDWKELVQQAPSGSHLYCCGPRDMIEAFRSSCLHLEPDRLHVEHFTSTVSEAVCEEFTVILGRSGRRISVSSGQTILEALEGAGIHAAHSCREGLCGACETRVLFGTPDHRDHILSAANRETGQSIMICCSRTLTPEICLDM